MTKTYVVMNDIQLPFEDRRVLNLVLHFVEDLKPTGVVLNGDITDCYSISSFVKNPMEIKDIQVEIDLSGQLMNRLAKVTTERWWVGGNHENRLKRYIWENADKFKRLGASFMATTTFSSLFHIADYGFGWLEYGEAVMLGKLMVTHGHFVSKHSAWSGKLTLDHYGTSVMVGHSHRLGVHYKRDVRGVHGAWENGCLCSLNPEYVRNPNWQQGFSVVHVESNGFYSVQQIPILPGPSFMYGKDKIK